MNQHQCRPQPVSNEHRQIAPLMVTIFISSRHFLPVRSLT
jgi:hypothetical protein